VHCRALGEMQRKSTDRRERCDRNQNRRAWIEKEGGRGESSLARARPDFGFNLPKGAQPPGRLATSMVLNWSDLKLVGGGIQNLVSHRLHHAAPAY
jgi:hypothetical protein